MKRLHKDKNFSEKRDKRASEVFKKFNKTEKFIEISKEAGKRGKIYLINYNKSEKARKKSSEVAHKKHVCHTCEKIVIGGFGLYNHIQKEHPTPVKCDSCGKLLKNQKALASHKRYCKNHKIVSIKKIKSPNTPVYCLTIPEYSNFALTSGVFVHNCGMCAVKTSLTNIDNKHLKKIMTKIRNRIPLGHKWHKDKQKLPENIEKPAGHVTEREFNKIPYQLGTLGGGNHFIEIQKDKSNNIWIMVHSGSRNLGKQVAEYYNKLAKEYNKNINSDIPTKWDLAYFPLDSKQGQEYFKEMQYCLDFAKENRFKMIEFIKKAILSVFKCKFDTTINIHHNYAVEETHFNQKLIIHRKGATSAKKDEIGIIPGSQGTPSYIVKGKGNTQSFMSCSHGCGRKMGRRQAQRELNLEKEIEFLNKKGIIHSIRNAKDLDEAPSAYKDINTVMEEQKDLVDIVTKLEPLAVVKG